MKLHARGVFVLALVLVSAAPGRAQDVEAPTVFRSKVDVVSVAAVVHDRHNRVVSSLTPDQFRVVDAGERRPIIDLHADASAPASVALLVDGSGSMALGAALDVSRRIADRLLASLDPARDTAALFTFDRRLVTLEDFTTDFARVRTSLGRLEAFGSTSLYDAIAGAAGLVGGRTQNRRALIVFTDGVDTGSKYSPERVSLIASSIDIPIYVFVLGPDVVDGTDTRSSTLATLARSTGGELIVANTPKLVDAGIRRLVEELRHQYVISFPAAPFDGLRRVQIQMVRNNLRVRARAWYFAGSE